MEESKIQMRITEEKGRALFAAKDFNIGDILFQEVPLVSCQFAWNEDYGYQACELCLRPLETALENVKRLTMNSFVSLPYSELCVIDKSRHVLCAQCGVKYCSEECQQVAWRKYHKTLCLQKFQRDNSHPLELLKDTWKQMHYPPETSTIMLVVKIFAMIHQSDDKDLAKNIFRQFFCCTINADENIAHKVMGLKFVEQLEVLRQGVVTAVPTEFVEEWVTPEGFSSLMALIGMNGQGIGSNSFSEWVKNFSKLELPDEEKKSINNYIEKIYDNFNNGVGDFLNNEGTGLYQTQSAINHSCTPNAEVTFPNANYQLAIKAIKNIHAGDEISISYLDDCILTRSRHSRQKILRENYLFTCKCEKCEEEIEQLDETSSEESEDLSDN